MQVTKLNASCRQVDSAIHLFFEEYDIISVHCLGASGSNILTDVAEKKKGTSWRARSQIDHNVPREDINRVFNDAWNFFKHGDRDPDGILSIDSLDTEYLLFLATLDAGELGIRTRSMEVYQAWFVCEYPQHFIQNFPFRDTAQRFFASQDWGDEVSSIEKARDLLNGYIKT